MTNTNYISELIKFQEKNLNIIDIKISDKSIEMFVEYSSVPGNICCPKCGSVYKNIHSYTLRKIKHSNLGDKSVILTLKLPRFICMEPECKKTYNLPTKIVEPNRRISNALLNDIKNQTSKKTSFKDVSEINNLSETTITREFKKQIDAFRCSLTEIICIDEFKASTIAGTYALIIGDPISGKILDILPQRKLDYLVYYFQTIDREEIKKVKYVVTDLFEAFRSIVNMEFPSAIHIADRFHWIRLATEAFNKMRIRIMNTYIKEAEKKDCKLKLENLHYANLLKNNYKLLLKNRYSCESWFFDQIIRQDKYGNNITIQNIIEECINNNTYLEAGYQLLQDLYRIAKFSNIHTINNNLTNWINKIIDSDLILPEFTKVALTYNSWKKEIMNSFIINPTTHQRISNGFIEGKNNFVKVIKRIGFGFKDFDLFRKKIIAVNNNTKN